MRTGSVFLMGRYRRRRRASRGPRSCLQHVTTFHTQCQRDWQRHQALLVSTHPRVASHLLQAAPQRWRPHAASRRQPTAAWRSLLASHGLTSAAGSSRRCNPPLPSSRHHQSNDDYLENKRDDYQNCSALYCVLQLCTVICCDCYVSLGFR